MGEIERPALAAGQVRVSVEAAGVGFADALMVAGTYQVKPTPPFVPGLEAFGTVTERAPGADGPPLGSRVVAVLEHGGYAEEVVAPAHRVFPVPDGIDPAVAATFPAAYGTAHLALAEKARLKAGETLLVRGAGGGVGRAAVELGKAFGARVIAAASSPARLAEAADAGADELVDVSTTRLRDRVREMTGGRGIDVVFDTVGTGFLDDCLRTLAWGGRVLIVGFAGGEIPSIPANRLLLRDAAAIGVAWGPSLDRHPEAVARSLATLFELVGSGVLRPRVSRTYPLAAAGQALEALRDRRGVGRVCLAVNGWQDAS